MSAATAEAHPPGTALAVQPIGQLARKQYAREQIDLIKLTVAKGASDAELDLFLELAARYQLDPFAGQIWCARMPGRDGEGTQMVTMVGRDGMLVIARRDDDFLGVHGDVVRAKDSFQKWEEDNGAIHVKHVVNEPDPKKRGEIVGAWARVRIKGKDDTYFFAPIDDYCPDRTTNRYKKTPWGKNESSMILKCAQSTALRFACSITGLIGAEEVSAHIIGGARAAEEPISVDDMEWGPDEEVAERLKLLFTTANGLEPGSFRPRKIQATLAGKNEGERVELIARLEQFIVEHGGTLPEPAPVDNTVDDPDEKIEDAVFEVIQDGEGEEQPPDPEPPDQESLGGE